MTNIEILDELFDYMFAEMVSLKENKGLKSFRRSITRTLHSSCDIAEEAYQLISDKRYHLKFDVTEGLFWHFEKLNKTVCNILRSDISELARIIRFKYISEEAMFKIIVHTLIVNFFNENDDLLSKISENPSVELLDGFFTNNPVDMGTKAN